MSTLKLNPTDQGGKKHHFKQVPQRSKQNNTNPAQSKTHEFN